MGILVECPNCKKRLSASATVCQSRGGKGCGAKIPPAQRIYWIEWMNPAGHKRSKKIGPNRKLAEDTLSKLKSDIVRDVYLDPRKRPKVLIGDFIEKKYKPWCEANNKGYANKRYFIDLIKKRWGGVLLDELSIEDIDLYRAESSETGRVQFNRVLATLNHMYTKAIEYGDAEKHPIPTLLKMRFKESKGREIFLTPEQAETLIQACTDHLRPIVITALHTGMRKSEILQLRVGENVDLAGRRIILHEGMTKTGQRRELPIDDTLAESLKGVLAGKQVGDYVFSTKAGKPYGNIKRAFASAKKKAGLDDLSFHDLRHTYASQLVMSGVDLYAVGRLLGHTNAKMTQRYAHLSPDYMAKAVSVLDRVMPGKPKRPNLELVKS